MSYVKPYFKRRFHTIPAIRALYRQHKTWQNVAEVIGAYSPAYWWGVTSGKFIISNAAREVLRFHYGLPPKRIRMVRRMARHTLAKYLHHRTPATYPPCVELWRP